mgnify:CR=1 FL=1
MKKHLFLTLIVFCFMSQLRAQNSEIRANIGLLTTADVGSFFGDLIINAITIGGYTTDNSTSIGAWGAEYWYFKTDRLKIGGLVSLQTIDKEVFFTGNKAGDITDNYYTILPQLSYEYLQAGWLRIYSGVGLGITIWEQNLKSSDPKLSGAKASDLMFNFHVNAIGARVGNAFGASLELGFGAKGILNAGLSYRF